MSPVTKYAPIVPVLLTMLLVSMAPVHADPITNGDFAAGNTGWDTTGTVFFFSDETASLREDLPYRNTDDKGNFSYSTLEQTFFHAASDTTLEFDFKIPDAGSETDYFQFLLNGTVVPVASTSNNDPGNIDPGNDTRYNNGEWHHWIEDISILPLGNTTVTFRLKGYEDILDTTVAIDNVTTTGVVPLPGAVLLGALGLSVAGWRLRRRDS